MAIEVFKLFGSIMVNNDEANKSISKTDEKAQGLGDKFVKGVGTAAKWGAAIAGAAVAGGAALYGMATKAAATADNIDKMSAKIGISKQGFQEWSYIMGQNGMDIDKLQTGMKTLVGKMDEAAGGSKTAAESFEKLGLSWEDGNGKLKSQEEMMNESILALASMENGTEKAKLATELFGKAGTEMMPMLNNGAEGIEALRDRAHELGLVMSDEAVNAGVVLGDTIDDVKQSFSAIVTKIGVEVMPIIQKLCDWVLANMPTIQLVFDAVFKAIEWGVTFVTGILNTFFTDLTTNLSNSGITWETIWSACQVIFDIFIENLKFLWDTVGQPLFELIVSIIGWVKDIFMEYWPMISSFFNQFVQDAKSLWENNLKPMFEAIGNFISNVLAPTFQYIFQNIISPIVGACFKGIIDLWNNSLKPMFQGIIDFITGVFTGNWRQAFQGISDIIGGIFGGMISIVKAPINAIIGMINKFIGGLNKLKIPDWIPFIGGNGISIPEIPMLAKGTDYFKGGMAIVGEQGPELVHMGQGARVTPNDETERLLSRKSSKNMELKLFLDGREFARALAQYTGEETAVFNLRTGLGGAY